MDCPKCELPLSDEAFEISYFAQDDFVDLNIDCDNAGCTYRGYVRIRPDDITDLP